MKTIRAWNPRTLNRKVVAFTNGFASYGKNDAGKYRIEAKMDFGIFSKDKFKVYQGDEKPVIRNLWIITIAVMPFTLIYLLIIPLGGLMIYYLEGLVNTVKDGVFQTGTRFFSITNMVIIAILVTLLLLKT